MVLVEIKKDIFNVISSTICILVGYILQRYTVLARVAVLNKQHYYFLCYIFLGASQTSNRLKVLVLLFFLTNYRIIFSKNKLFRFSY